jgi:hypothetical protein
MSVIAIKPMFLLIVPDDSIVPLVPKQLQGTRSRRRTTNTETATKTTSRLIIPNVAKRMPSIMPIANAPSRSGTTRLKIKLGSQPTPGSERKLI